MVYGIVKLRKRVISMKNYSVFYYIPAILYILIFIYGAAQDGLWVVLQPVVLFNTACMAVFALMMQKGKVIGAYFGIAFGVLWIVYDVLYHHINGYGRLVPLEIICIPLIIYYIYCAVAVKTKPKEK